LALALALALALKLKAVLASAASMSPWKSTVEKSQAVGAAIS